MVSGFQKIFRRVGTGAWKSSSAVNSLNSREFDCRSAPAGGERIKGRAVAIGPERLQFFHPERFRLPP